MGDAAWKGVLQCKLLKACAVQRLPVGPGESALARANAFVILTSLMVSKLQLVETDVFAECSWVLA